MTCGPQHRGLSRDRKINGPLRLTHGDLHEPTDNEPGIVLMFKPVISLGEVAHNAILVTRLLMPLDEGVARARHRTGESPRPRSSAD